MMQKGALSKYTDLIVKLFNFIKDLDFKYHDY